MVSESERCKRVAGRKFVPEGWHRTRSERPSGPASGRLRETSTLGEGFNQLVSTHLKGTCTGTIVTLEGVSTLHTGPLVANPLGAKSGARDFDQYVCGGDSCLTVGNKSSKKTSLERSARAAASDFPHAL